MFKEEIFDWEPGEHLLVLGPTGQGKTTTILNLIDLRQYVVAFATKPRDTSMDYLLRKGYIKIDSWKSLDPDEYPRRVLWPDVTHLNSGRMQKAVFADALNKIYGEGGWTVVFDELAYVAVDLNLSRTIATFLQQSRALGISVASGTQRPAYIPVTAYSSATHAFFLKTNDDRDLRRYGELLPSLDMYTAKRILSNLDRFQILYSNTRTGFTCRTTPPKLEV